jgi:hypothetical protein
MNTDYTFPPPFVVGNKYGDREGEYTVIATDENQVTIERSDGRRATADVTLKARIHRNLVVDRDASPVTGGVYRGKKRGEPTGRRKNLMEEILQFEADGADHSGVEIDQALARVAQDFGYSDQDFTRLLSTGRSAFGNDGDWAKAKLTEDGLHEVVGTTAYWEGHVRRHCNVYRITAAGLDDLQRPGLPRRPRSRSAPRRATS